MTEFLEPQLRAEGYNKCAEPVQVPATHLLDDYLALSRKVMTDQLTNQNIRVQIDSPKVGASESLIVDGQTKLSKKNLSFLSSETVQVEDPATGIRETHMSPSNKGEVAFKTKDESGKEVAVTAQTNDGKVVSEDIVRDGLRTRIEFANDGRAKGATCANDDNEIVFSRGTLGNDRKADVETLEDANLSDHFGIKPTAPGLQNMSDKELEQAARIIHELDQLKLDPKILKERPNADMIIDMRSHEIMKLNPTELYVGDKNSSAAESNLPIHHHHKGHRAVRHIGSKDQSQKGD